MNNTMKLINERVSIRKFNDKPISEEIMDQIVYAAMRAPTAGNMMMYSIIEIKDKKLYFRAYGYEGGEVFLIDEFVKYWSK